MKRRFFIGLASTILFAGLFKENVAQQGAIKTENPMRQKEYRSPLDIPVESFFRNPVKSSFKISPDGKTLAFLAPVEGRMNIHVQVLGQTEVKKLTAITDRDIATIGWASNEIIVFLKDTGGDENWVLHSVNVKTGVSQAITKPGTRTEIMDLLDNDDDHIVVSSNMRDPELFDLYTVNLKTSKFDFLAVNPGDVTTWILDHTGTPRLAISTNGVKSVLKRKHPEGKWINIIETDFTESINPICFDFENKNVYCSSNIGRDKSAIVLIDIETAKELEVLYEHSDVDVYELTYSKKRKTITSVMYETEKMNREVMDPSMEVVYTTIASKLGPNELFQITDKDAEENIYVVRSYSDISLGAYYTYNVKNKELKLLESLSPWLPQNMMCEMQPVSYTNASGFTIHGYLTLPKGGKTLLPVVINPHGGPWARDSWGFNPEVQFLASRGFAVFQMNFTGSTGYGRKFWQSSFKQWGQIMQDDITEGVNYLIRQRIADEKRIAIYGGSYGGYATLAGLTLTPDLYACGIDYVGVSNLFTFLESIPPYWEPYRQMLYEMVGNPETDADMLRAYSPVFRSEKINVPLMIAQGAKDPRVNIKESEQMVDALRARGVEVKYLMEPEEGHGFRNEENRFKFYRAMENFLYQNLGATKVDKDAGGK
jgi:dipeptidyl aminopeptidase/acylaminoacyl peptidase